MKCFINMIETAIPFTPIYQNHSGHHLLFILEHFHTVMAYRSMVRYLLLMVPGSHIWKIAHEGILCLFCVCHPSIMHCSRCTQCTNLLANDCTWAVHFTSMINPPASAKPFFCSERMVPYRTALCPRSIFIRIKAILTFEHRPVN